MTYENTIGVLPFGQGGDYMSVLPSAPLYAHWSAQSQLLGYLEQMPLLNSINFSLPPETPDVGAMGMAMGMNMLIAYQDPNRENSTAVFLTFSKSSDEGKFEIFPESETVFFIKQGANDLITFVKDDQGKVTHAAAHEGGHDVKAKRLADDAKANATK